MQIVYISPLDEAFPELNSLPSPNLNSLLRADTTFSSMLTLLSQDPRTIVLYGPRFIRGILNLRDHHLGELIWFDTINEICRSVLELFQSRDIETFRNTFIDTFTKSGIQDYLDSKIYEVEDIASWQACNPGLISRKVADLNRSTRGEAILFLPLAHGALRCGIDFFLRYNSVHACSNSFFYPIRFSAQKVGHKHPKLPISERDKLLELSSEFAKIVLFDDDVDSGHTLTTARLWLESILEIDNTRLITLSIL